jgi:hypothetical protein
LHQNLRFGLKPKGKLLPMVAIFKKQQLKCKLKLNEDKIDNTDSSKAIKEEVEILQKDLNKLKNRKAD